jgi:hypothetical protein
MNCGLHEMYFGLARLLQLNSFTSLWETFDPKIFGFLTYPLSVSTSHFPHLSQEN